MLSNNYQGAVYINIFIMKSSYLVLTIILIGLGAPVYGQEKTNLWTMEVYRTGQILSFERSVDGVVTESFSNEAVNNIIYNNYLEEYGGYGRVDLTIMQFILFNQNQSTYWSYNITVGAFLNEEPVTFSGIDNYFGIGADFDLSVAEIYRDNGQSVSFDNGTIGLNIRWDMEIGERLILQNSVTRGWWGSTNARKWDIRSMLGVETFEGLYITAAPNFISLSSEETDENTNVTTKDLSRHLYTTFGFAFTF